MSWFCLRFLSLLFFFFFNDPATTEIYTLSLHDALPILVVAWLLIAGTAGAAVWLVRRAGRPAAAAAVGRLVERSEEHTSELQSQSNIVCRLLLEKKKKKQDSTKT